MAMEAILGLKAASEKAMAKNPKPTGEDIVAALENLTFEAPSGTVKMCIQALASGHVGPEMSYWTTSGEFVFIALLGGTAHVGAIISAAVIFEFIKTWVTQISPYTWQMFLGIVLLVIIMFLPKGLWSLLARARRARRAEGTAQ